MLQAFQDIGYEVSVVMGNASQRRRQIASIKTDLRHGKKFDFVYSEASTMPTLLVDHHRLPLHPFMDFSFLYFCKRNGVPIGLFYRDIRWRFPDFVESVGKFQATLARLLYQIDIRAYERLLTLLYVPTVKVAELTQSLRLARIAKELPPGCPNGPIRDFRDLSARVPTLNLLYVGALGGYYDIGIVLDAVLKDPDLNLTVCTREKEWVDYSRSRPAVRTCPRVSVVYLSGEELEPLYAAADICILTLRPDPYLGIAVPVKLMEYLGHGIPIIETVGSEGSRIVSELGAGWVIPWEESSLVHLLASLRSDPNLIIHAHRKSVAAIENNTWQARAKQVVTDLALAEGFKP
jgi:glycosyltransferase involved in cell wall biosynthesis